MFGKMLPTELEKGIFLANTPKFEVLDWQPVSPVEKIEISRNATYDIDFVAVVGILQNVLTDDNFIELVGNSSGKICRCTSLQNVRAKNFGRMLLYAKLGDWLVGEPLTREVLEEAEDMEFNEHQAESNATSTQVGRLKFRFCVTI